MLHLLSGCLSSRESLDYPTSWAPVKANPEPDSWPGIEGTYENFGEYRAIASGRPCEGTQCKSLRFALLDGADVNVLLPYPQEPDVTAVRIERLDPSTLQVTTLPDMESFLLRSEEGDYACENGGLRWRDTSDFSTALISSIHTVERRIFYAAEDGSLVMQVEWRNRGLHAIVAYDVENTGWVRWKRVD